MLSDYLQSLGARADAAGLPAPAIMQSSGGLMPLEHAAAHASRTVLSGPAGGVVGAADVARADGADVALAFDMGGTSCDVALITYGSTQKSDRSRNLAGQIHALLTGQVGLGGGAPDLTDAAAVATEDTSPQVCEQQGPARRVATAPTG